MTDLQTKLTEFHNAIKDIETALNNTSGGGYSLKNLNEVADKINSVVTHQNMGTKTVEIKQNAVIFGVKVDESEQEPTNRISYLDDAKGMVSLYNDLETGNCNYGTWKNSWILEKIYPVMLNTDGTVAYKLDPENQTLKSNGDLSDINNINFNGNAMVKVEKFYTQFSMNGEDEEIRISNVKLPGYEAIGFIRKDGTETDCFYLPMFGGNKDSSGKLRSIGNQDWAFSIAWTDSVTAAEKNGSGYGIESWAMNQAFSAVVTILIKSCDWQKKIGEGRKYSGAKTGVLTNKGAFGYNPSTKTVKALWVEDFVSNQSEGMTRWEAGILSVYNKVYVKMKPPYSDTSISGYTEVTDHVVGNGKYISKMKANNKYGRIPIAYEGSQTTYENAHWYTQSDNDKLCGSVRSANYGVWGRFMLKIASYAHRTIGAALTYLPPA